MQSQSAINQLSDLNPDAILFENLNSAIIGIGRIGNNDPVAIYSQTLIFAQLEKDGFTAEEAEAFYQNNLVSLVATKDTPVIVDDLSEV